MRTRRFPIACIAALALALAACTPPTNTFVGDTRVVLSGDQATLTLHGRNGAKARIGEDGGLAIDDRDVPLDDAQRALLRDYVAAIARVRAGGIAMAGEGLDVAKAALGDVARRATGQTGDATTQRDEARQALERERAALERSAGEVRTLQQRIAREVPALAPLLPEELAANLAGGEDERR